jgi:hypothetical protein
MMSVKRRAFSLPIKGSLGKIWGKVWLIDASCLRNVSCHVVFKRPHASGIDSFLLEDLTGRSAPHLTMLQQFVPFKSLLELAEFLRLGVSSSRSPGASQKCA